MKSLLRTITLLSHFVRLSIKVGGIVAEKIFHPLFIDSTFYLYKNGEPRTMKNSVRKIIKKIKQFRLIGYVVIGVSLYELHEDISYVLTNFLLLIFLTELTSRNIDKKHIEPLLDNIEEDQIIKLEDKKKIRRKVIDKKIKKGQKKVKKQIEDNYLQ